MNWLIYGYVGYVVEGGDECCISKGVVLRDTLFYDADGLGE